MKIRTSFVSNSSSSSFIVGIAKVQDKGESMWTVEFPCEQNSYRCDEPPYPIKIGNIDEDKMTCDLKICTIWDAVRLCDVKFGENIIFVDGTTKEDEDVLFWDGEYSEYDYDVDLEDFEDRDIFTYNRIQELNGVAEYGAGRE